MNNVQTTLGQQSSTLSSELSHRRTQSQHGSGGGPSHPIETITTGETMLATLPAYGPGGQTSWPDISSIPGEPPSEATLTTSSEVVYPDAMLRSHPDSMGWNLGTSHWPRSLDGQASLWAASTAQESYPLPPASSDAWPQSKTQEALDFERYGAEYNNIHQTFPMHDEHVVDLRFTVPQTETHLAPWERVSGRPPSGSSFSMSSIGYSGDAPPPIEEPPLTLTRSVQAADYSARSSMDSSSFPAANLLHSPRHPLRQELTGAGGRGRASSSPRRSVRTAPSPLDLGRVNRWSTGSFSTPPAPHGSPLGYPTSAGYPQYSMREVSIPFSPLQPYPGLAPSPSSHHGHDTPISATQPLTFPQPGALLSPPIIPADHREHGETSAHPPPHPVLYRTPQQYPGAPSTPQGFSGMDVSTPPDLYASLRMEETAPPPEDLNTLDPGLVPHQQDLRFDGDLYTPRWVRGQGNKREGWCGVCKPGRWLVLKNSAFWYDKSFSHGISAATGGPFDGPQAHRRLQGNPDVWEGYCGSCHDWIALVSSKRKGTTWFRHAYKCHTPPRTKDPPKRRRDGSLSPVTTSTSSKRIKALPPAPSPGSGS